MFPIQEVSMNNTNCDCYPMPSGTSPDCIVHGLSNVAEKKRYETTIKRFHDALATIANLWPIDTTAKIGSVSDINDGRSRAIIAEAAVVMARRALGIEQMP